MSILEMAKAHLQNVHSRVEELQKQKKMIEDEISKLTLYISKGLEEIEEEEVEQKSVNVSTK